MSITAINNLMQSSMLQEMARLKTIADASPADHASASSSATVSFAQILKSALHQVDQSQQTAQARQNAIDMGQSDDLVGAMIASQQASLSFSALVQIRNKMATGFNDLMNMSI